ncbi:phage tail protein I [Domibacillus antri]|uniref:Phage tail protein I n=1 Tax=Domibacillus antri TaxID=1714264 RepID=A0A1Q8Q247_9BACI|nr:phage tail protein I [Domibacillus antri]OLN21392.1 phage tail protein I [Domibacillus antri]
MTNSLENIDLKKLLPTALKNDTFTVALADALNTQLKDALQRTDIVDPKKTIPAHLLDFVAYENHVDFYEPSLPEVVKRELIAKSDYLHEIKGTPAAVEELITTIFGEGLVEEWFDYDGLPYHFRVVTNNDEVTNERAHSFIKALNTVKNRRSVLDNVIIRQTEHMGNYFGGVVHIGENILIK